MTKNKYSQDNFFHFFKQMGHRALRSFTVLLQAESLIIISLLLELSFPHHVSASTAGNKLRIANDTTRAFSLNSQLLDQNRETSQKEVLLAQEAKNADKSFIFSAPIQTPKKVIRVRATAYSSTPDQTDLTPFITANGWHVYDGLVAANFLPFGTKIKIPSLFGDKEFTVNDRMNVRYGSGIVDIWMNTRLEAKMFGVKRGLEMEIY